METECQNEQAGDAQCVAAVRAGEVERYRELVERHERRVYGVAWSRLGDVTLAEEATQEAFITGYRRLWLLGDGAKFSAWIAAIARNTAINLGLRHRRELNKRDRWGLEQAATEEPALIEADDDVAGSTAENLRKTLAELPAAHRECLVLYYLEGKSCAEAAMALGSSESTFRVRLHRARCALRERLEERLEGSLQKLRPAKSIVPAVMAAVLATSSAKAATGGTIAAGAGAKVLSALGKTSLLAWMLPFIGLVSMIPSVVIAIWFGRMERANYRDAEGFRARSSRDFFRSFAWGYPLMVLLMFILTYIAIRLLGLRNGPQTLAAAVTIPALVVSLRSLAVFRSPFHIGMLVYVAILGAGALGSLAGWIPISLTTVPFMFATLSLSFFLKNRPMRMDYNLFLRQAKGMLDRPADSVAAPSATTQPMDRRALLTFARFLGARFLVINFRWEGGDLMLRLPPAKPDFLGSMLSVLKGPVSRSASFLKLQCDGSVIARCGTKDAASLMSLRDETDSGHRADFPGVRQLEEHVSAAVRGAWEELRAGNTSAAERSLGEVSESAIFRVPPARSASTRMWRIMLVASVVLMWTATAFRFIHLQTLSGLKPVSVSEQEVRAYLENPDTQLRDALYRCLVLPSTNHLSQQALQRLKKDAVENLKSDPDHPGRIHPVALQSGRVLQQGMATGWFNWQDLGLTPEEVRQFYHEPPSKFPDPRVFLLTSGDSWSWATHEKFPVSRIEEFGLVQLRWWRTVDCLDLLKPKDIAQQIASAQVLSGSPPGQPPIHHWLDIRGLFFTPGWPALQDTYYSVASLEILGALDKIDREACIQGILSVHKGKGLFGSPPSGGTGGYNEYKIAGDTRDTICAFESLRILGGLDRLTDLAEWKFRVRKSSGDPTSLDWYEVEAWVCQQRLQEILRDRKNHPNIPTRSLLDPD